MVVDGDIAEMLAVAGHASVRNAMEGYLKTNYAL